MWFFLVRDGFVGENGDGVDEGIMDRRITGPATGSCLEPGICFHSFLRSRDVSEIDPYMDGPTVPGKPLLRFRIFSLHSGISTVLRTISGNEILRCIYSCQRRLGKKRKLFNYKMDNTLALSLTITPSSTMPPSRCL